MIIDDDMKISNPEGMTYIGRYVIPSGFRVISSSSRILPSLRDWESSIRHHRDRGEEQNKNDEHHKSQHAAAGVEFGDVVKRLCADVAQPVQDEHPQKPTEVERFERKSQQGWENAQRDQRSDGEGKNLPRFIAEQAVRHVTAIERPNWDEIQRGDEQSRPASERDRMKLHVHAAEGNGRT